MDDNRDEFDDYNPEETEEDKRHEAEFQEMIQTHIKAGWTWDASKSTLIHPSDHSKNRCFDPYTHEEFISAEEVEAIKRELERERQGGES